jgi:hypothetical protein
MKTVLKIVLALLQVRTGVELGRAGSHVSAAADFGGSMGMNFAAIDSVCEDTVHLNDAGQVIGTAGWVGTWYSLRAIATDDQTDRAGFWATLGASYLTAIATGSKVPLSLTQKLAQIGSGLAVADIGRIQKLPNVRNLGLASAGLSALSGFFGVQPHTKLRVISQRVIEVAAAALTANAAQQIANDVRTRRL